MSIIEPKQVELTRQASASILWAGGVSLGVLFLVGGLLLGFAISRPRPKFAALVVVNTTFQAGQGIKTQRKAYIPANCIPKNERWIHYDADLSHHMAPFNFVLTDAPGPPNGPLEIPTSPRLPVGTGNYFEQMSAQGCGWLSGVFPPLGDTSKPVHVTILPPPDN